MTNEKQPLTQNMDGMNDAQRDIMDILSEGDEDETDEDRMKLLKSGDI